MQSIIMNYMDKVAYSDVKANKIPLAASARSRATLWCLRPGQHIHPHVHEGDHIWMVLEGEGEFSDGSSVTALGPGSFLFLPAGQAHGVANTSEADLVFVSVSA